MWKSGECIMVEVSWTDLLRAMNPTVFDSGKIIRIQFLRKVFGIVAAQLTILCVSTAIIFCSSNVLSFLNSYWMIKFIIACAAVFMFSMIELSQRRYPDNLIYLTIFTLLESLLFAAVLPKDNMVVIAQALVITSLIIMGLIMFTFQTKYDYNINVGVIFTLFGILLGLPIIGIFFPTTLIGFGTSLTLVGIFAAIFIYDLQAIMKNRHPEEYILAALDIYLDVTRIFKEILRMLRN